MNLGSATVNFSADVMGKSLLTRRRSEDDLLRSGKENISPFSQLREVNKGDDVLERELPATKKACVEQQQMLQVTFGTVGVPSITVGVRGDGTEAKKARSYSFSDIEGFTEDFCEANLIGNFQFGKVYRGRIGSKAVLVKKWESSEIYWYRRGDNEERVNVEIDLLKLEKWSRHPNLPKLIGYCLEGEEKVGTIYDLNPLDSVQNLVPKDCFTWLQRMKVIIEFARLLEFMHIEDPPDLCYILRNIHADHIMLDKDYNPILVDFSMVSGGIVPNRDPHERLNGCFDYVDIHTSRAGIYSEDTDIHCFGVLLTVLISKRDYTEEDRLTRPDRACTYLWALGQYSSYKSKSSDKSKFSLVHESLHNNEGFYPSDGCTLTRLARSCLNRRYWERPSMEEIVEQLLKLEVVKENAEFLGQN